MKVIMKTIKPKTCANIINLIQSILVIKSKREATAIQKLIDAYGFAEIYAYCSKSNTQYLVGSKNKVCEIITKSANTRFSPSIDKYTGNGKVLFKFRCYKVEEIGMWNYSEYGTPTLMENSLCLYSCLNFLELKDYLKGKIGYAIHISDLEIFDRPRDVSEFHTNIKKEPPEELLCPECGKPMEYYEYKYLTKAPQNFCYVEVDYE